MIRILKTLIKSSQNTLLNRIFTVCISELLYPYAVTRDLFFYWTNFYLIFLQKFAFQKPKSLYKAENSLDRKYGYFSARKAENQKAKKIWPNFLKGRKIVWSISVIRPKIAANGLSGPSFARAYFGLLGQKLYGQFQS